MSTPTWRKAAAVIICAKSHDHYKICFVVRSAASRVFPGSYVFPGGTLEQGDLEMAREIGSPQDLDDAALRVCAIREVMEETGIVLTENPRVVDRSNRSKLDVNDARDSISALIPMVKWKTPLEFAAMQAKGGFETSFFLAITSDFPTYAATADGTETDELVWLKPSEALSGAKQYKLPLPQLYMATELNACPRHNELRAFANSLHRGIFKYPFMPNKIQVSEHEFALILPGDAEHHGYRSARGPDWKHRGVYSLPHLGEPAARLERSHDMLREAARAARSGRDWCENVPLISASKL
jgi:8-oxo-dGTP pyrophosphatase MutT (NUDIX family)